MLSILFIPGASYSYAQDVKTQQKSSASEVRIPTDERLTEISENPDYFYDEVVQEPTLWNRFIMWLNQLLNDWVSTDFMSTLIKVVSAIAFVLVLLLLINQITQGELKNALLRRKNRTILDLRKEGKIVADHQLDKHIQDAINQKKYGVAVRYLYQKSLYMLREGELINWKADKTNHEYLYELGDHPASIPFDRLTYFYEYVDYGDFEVDEPRFRIIEKVFDEFKQKVDTGL